MKYFFLLGLIVTYQANAVQTRSQGSVTLENRFFDNDNNANTFDQNYALASKVDGEIQHHNVSFQYNLFARADFRDSSRNQYFISEANLSYEPIENWQIGIGPQFRNFSNMEAFHPADIFNARNFDSDFENAEKIGQMALSLTRHFTGGKLELFATPRLSGMRYPANTNRLGMGVISQLMEKELWMDGRGESRRNNWSQAGARLEFYFENIDFNLFYARLYDRFAPEFAIMTTGFPNFTPTAVYPVYFLANHTGGAMQANLGQAHLLKLEFLHKSYDISNQSVHEGVVLKNGSGADLARPNHLTTAVGYEYSINHQSGRDSNFFLEWSRIHLEKNKRSGLGFFQNDLFIGHRFSLNDVLARELTSSIIYDLDKSKEYMLQLAYSQRLNDQWKLATGLRGILAKNNGNQSGQTGLGLALFERASHVYCNLTRFF